MINCGSSFLSTWFRDPQMSDSCIVYFNESYYIDRDPNAFEYVLNFLHNTNFIKSKALFDNFEMVLREMEFYGILEGVEELRKIQLELYSTYNTKENYAHPPFWLKFCVGGTFFSTSVETIKYDEKCTIYEWVNAVETCNLKKACEIEYNLKGRYDVHKKIYYLDRNPKYFAFILDYLRSQMVNKSQELIDNFGGIMNEAQFFGMCAMVKALLEAKRLYKKG